MEKTLSDPIIIVGTPRSFTSLTSGVFRDHGVWFGECKGYHDFCPTGSCENKKMKAILKKEKHGAVLKGEVLEPIAGFRAMIEEIMDDEGYYRGPYAFKHSAMFHRCWEEFDAKFICCRRDKEAVLASGKYTNMWAANEHSWNVHQEVMDELVESGKGINVYGEEYFKGNWSSLEKAFEFAGLEFDVDIAENLLDHKHKHF